MEGNIEKESGAYGHFLNVISDLRGSSVIWEDFTSKATKLHTSLKSTLTAVAAFLDAFQKVADMATSSKGATKEIGSALTRLCLRHKAIETKLKKFTGTILESIVTPIQDNMEDWKKIVVQFDKDHSKEYKKAKLEIKKCSADTAKLQKKVKKGKPDTQSRLDSAIQEVKDKYILLEEQEKSALRTALIEERGRFCLFISCLKPFVDEEIGLLTEVTHLQEVMDNLCQQADSPKSLPPSSEQIIKDLKGQDAESWKFQTPPSSPSSLGSRKSSMCSINSIASSSSGSVQSHSPCHIKNIQQASDNASQGTDTPEMGSTPSTPSESYPNTPSATSTWKNWPNPPSAGKTEAGRPHTISSAYEKSHARPALSSHTFEPPQPASQENLKSTDDFKHDATVIKRDRPHSTAVPYNRPSAVINKMQPVLPPLGPKPKSRAVAPPKVPPPGEPPIYANLNELSPGDEVDADRTPTGREPPHSAGLHPKIQKNSLELAAAIKELEASTAALENSYESEKQASQASLQCSSGYGTMSSTPAGSEDTIASGGIPVSAQGGGVLARRSSMNHAKPPPPVRRSSSISHGANPALLQKYRTSPPKQLPHLSQTNAQQPSHKRTSSASGSPAGAEPAYAELQEIQASIQARQRQQEYYGEGYRQAGVSPQYAEPVTIVNSSTVNSLDSKFSAMNLTQTQNITKTSISHTKPVPSTGFTSQTKVSGGDFPDLPPPPTDAELREIEEIYSVPNPNVSQTHVHHVQTRNNVQTRPQQQQQQPQNPVGGMDFRQSLISEMKSGNKFRKMSQSDQGAESEC